MEYSISSVKVVSFDIFDTLLLRPLANPQDLWKIIETEEQASGFAKARKEADAITYKISSKENRETTIEEAYAIMPQKYQCLMSKEMDTERKLLRANPEILNVWEQAGKEGKIRVITSDMYLSRDFLESVLRENGISDWDKFYLSRDYNARKATGKLFQIMLEDLKVDPTDVLHIGDNELSDVNIPKEMGIHTVHYPKVYDRLVEVCPFVKNVECQLAGALAIGWNQFCIIHKTPSYWHRLGFMLGGVMGYVYVKWIVETARQLGKERLLFVARDGYIWQKICHSLYPDMKTDYVYAPRRTSIAVNGAVGSDPYAVKDRQKYLDSKLKGVNVQSVKEQYTQYVSSLNIDEKCALVDGCSSGFSAQRLIEECLGKQLFSFYLLAMANRNFIGALYQTQLYSLPFQLMSEFLFGSPEPPIREIQDKKPVYDMTMSKQEKFKTSVSEMITEGAIECAKVLGEEKIDITTAELLDYFDSFMKKLTDEDKKELIQANNAADVEQKSFKKVTYRPLGRLGIFPVMHNSLIIGVGLKIADTLYSIHMSKKGPRFLIKNAAYKSKVVNYE